MILAHENCSGYGREPRGFPRTDRGGGQPAFKLIIDTGNNSLHHNDNEATWDYYTKCRAHIVHVHIKSAKPNPAGGDWITCHVDEDRLQRRILEDLERTGYNGWLSIETHIKAAIHAEQDVDDTAKPAGSGWNTPVASRSW